MRCAFPLTLVGVLLFTGFTSAQQSTSKPGTTPPASAPATSTPAATKDDNPFPEDVSRKAAAAAKQNQKVDSSSSSEPPVASRPESSGESSSSNGYEAPAANNLAPAENPQRRKLRIDGEDAIGRPHADHIATKDEDIADLYFKDGNYAGALLRYQDALHFVPDDETAAWGIAESARRLGKRDQALAAYATYLKLAPQGRKAKQARKEMAELNGSRKR